MATAGIFALCIQAFALPAHAQISYKTDPTVSITPLYGSRSMVGLTDAPTAFTASTNPVSTYYAPAKHPTASGSFTGTTHTRTTHTGTTHTGQPVSITLHGPIPQKPTVTAPAQPSVYGHTYTAPQSQSLSIATATPSSHTPQQPQISWPNVPAGTITPPSGVIASPQLADGSYWEQVSGPTLFGDTLATKVICKRPAPAAPVAPPPVQQQHTITTIQTPQFTPPPQCAPAPVGFPPAFLPIYPAPAPVFRPAPPVFLPNRCGAPLPRPTCGPSAPVFPPHFPPQFTGHGVNTGPALPYMGHNPAPYGILAPNSRWTY